jgi:hypothetical protein
MVKQAFRSALDTTAVEQAFRPALDTTAVKQAFRPALQIHDASGFSRCGFSR